MNFGERYRELRESIKDVGIRGINVKCFAERVGLTPPRISELENNKRAMSLTELQAYHKYFNVSYEYLLGETDVKSTNIDIQAIRQYTGLNEDTIQRMQKEMHLYSADSGAFAPDEEARVKKQHLYTINSILKSDEFYKIIHLLFDLQTNLKECALKKLVYDELNLKNDDFDFFRPDSLSEYGNINLICSVHRYNVAKEIEHVSDLFDIRDKIHSLNRIELLNYVDMTEQDLKEYINEFYSNPKDEVPDWLKDLYEEAEPNGNNNSTEE